MYIDIKDYFKYLKKVIIAELERIAQALGAKHFRVSILEESSASSIKKDKGEVKLGIYKNKAGVKVESEHVSLFFTRKLDWFLLLNGFALYFVPYFDLKRHTGR